MKMGGSVSAIENIISQAPGTEYTPNWLWFAIWGSRYYDLSDNREFIEFSIINCVFLGSKCLNANWPLVYW